MSPCIEVYCLPLLRVHVKSCPTLCDPADCSPPGSAVHGILQARILEWVTMPSSRRSSRPRDRTHVSYICIGRWILCHECLFSYTVSSLMAEVGLKLGNLEGHPVYSPVDRRTNEAYGAGLLDVKFKPFSLVCGDGVGKEGRDRGQGSLSPCIWVAESAPHPLFHSRH